MTSHFPLEKLLSHQLMSSVLRKYECFTTMRRFKSWSSAKYIADTHSYMILIFCIYVCVCILRR